MKMFFLSILFLLQITLLIAQKYQRQDTISSTHHNDSLDLKRNNQPDTLRYPRTLHDSPRANPRTKPYRDSLQIDDRNPKQPKMKRDSIYKN